jgi:hypothetical protein
MSRRIRGDESAYDVLMNLRGLLALVLGTRLAALGCDSDTLPAVTSCASYQTPGPAILIVVPPAQ